MNSREQRGGAGEREAGEGDEAEPGQGRRQSLVVAHETAEARLAGKRALHCPPLAEQDEAARPLGMLDHLQLDATGRRLGGRLLPRVTLIDVGQLDRPAGRLLHRPRQALDRRPVLLVGGRDMRGEPVSVRRVVFCRVDRLSDAGLA